MTVKFHPGKTYATPGALRALVEAGQSPVEFLERHLSGDWGDTDPHDSALNDLALRSGEDRIFSAYHTAKGERLWVITEWDRSATTILLPEEY